MVKKFKGIKKIKEERKKVEIAKYSKKSDSKKIKELKHKARRHSIKEGIFAHFKEGAGHNYVAPFAIAINASNSLVALLSSIAGLLGPMSQMFNSRLMEKYSRKKIVMRFAFLEALVWIPLIVIAILFHYGIITSFLPLLLLLFFSLYIILFNAGIPAWFSWLGDLVDEEFRGRWFAKRNLILGFILTATTLLAALILDIFKKIDLTMAGFIILFVIALIARLICVRILRKQYEPKIKLEKGYYFSFMQFISKAKDDNFAKFSIFKAFLVLAASISSPLVAVYLLRELQFSYITYMIVFFSGTIFSLIVIELWGKFADRYGNYRVFIITSLLIPIIPILWILSPNPFYLIFIPSLIGGIAWSGFNLASGNFVYDNVSPQKRGLAVSYYNMLSGIGIFLGAGISALLIRYLTIDIIKPLFAIFIISAIVRMATVFIFIKKIKEVRKTEKFKSSRVLKNLIFKEAKPTLIEEAHEIMHIRKYLRE